MRLSSYVTGARLLTPLVADVQRVFGTFSKQVKSRMIVVLRISIRDDSQLENRSFRPMFS